MTLTTDQFTNFALSTLAGGGTGAGGSLVAGDTTVTLKTGDGAKFSATAGGSFLGMLGSALGAHELVKVTARTSDTLTITRAQEGTAAQAWALGTFVQQVATAGNWSNLWSRVQGVTYNVTDYGAVGDGVTDDIAAIQAAITAAQNAGGGTVFFPGGIFLVSTDPTVTGSNITLLGSMGATLKAANTARPNCLTLNGASHVRVVGLAFDGNRANNSTTISYITGACIRIYNCDDVEVTDCYLHDASAAGLYAEGSTHLRITGNRVYNTFDGGIFLHPQTLGGCVDVTIANNAVSYAGYYGITAIRSDYVSIIGNTSAFNGQQDAGQGFGIDLEGSRYSVIAGNVSHDNHGGIICRNTTEGGALQRCLIVSITGNTCFNNTPGGTHGEASIDITDSDYVTISGNTCSTSQGGIVVNGGGPTNVLIVGNICTAHNTQGIGVIDPTSANVAVLNNLVYANSNNGISVAVPNATIRGNVVWGNTLEGINVLNGASGAVISGNLIYDNTDNGVLVNATTTANIEVSDNTFTNTASAQGRALYEQSGAGPTYMRNNRIRNQANQPYFFNNAASRYADEHTQASVTITAAYTALIDDVVILCNAAAALTVTLPSASVVGLGHIYTVKDHNGVAATLTITVATTSAQTIDGASTKTITTAYGSLRVISDGTNWSVI